MNEITYFNNDPTKPIIYIGIIFFCCKLNKIKAN